MENKVTIKECTIFFDKDNYQLRRKPYKKPPIAYLVCDGKNIGTLELGYFDFNLFNIVNVVPIHNSVPGDLYVIINKFNRPKIAKNILYNIAINAIYNFVCEDRLDNTIYIVRVSNMAAPMENNEKDPCGLESYIDACYWYIKNTYKEENNTQMKFEDIDNEDSDKDQYNEFEEEDNPAYCKPDDPDKELNARYV